MVATERIIEDGFFVLLLIGVLALLRFRPWRRRRATRQKEEGGGRTTTESARKRAA